MAFICDLRVFWCKNNKMYNQIKKTLKNKKTMKLQNNFTTPEQSKRLLELGLPQDSADCCIIGTNAIYVLSNLKFSQERQLYNKEMLPCWSVGRLIEIAFATRNNENKDKTDFVIPIEFVQDDKGTMEHMVEHFELCTDYYDFSKLED